MTLNTEQESHKLTLQPYDWQSEDVDEKFEIRLWTHNRNSERVLLRIDDYEVFCRLALPVFVNGRRATWTKEALVVYTQWIRTVLGNHQPVRIIYFEHEKLYWYKNRNKYPYLTLYFDSYDALRHCTNLINKKGYVINQLGFVQSKIVETSITPIHKFVTDIKLGYCQWFDVVATPVNELDKISYCEHEYIASYKNIKPIPKDLTESWVCKPLIAAIDIECNSSNTRAMPNRNYVQDVVFQISYITQILGDRDSRKNYALVLGVCDPVPGVNVTLFSNEIDLIEAMCELIRKTDPTVILGYNIYGFDFPYMDARLKLYLREWSQSGLIKDKKTYLANNSWKSSAYGFVENHILDMEGRLCIDMYPVIKRSEKLDIYTLDFVSKEILGRGKHDVTPQEMFRIYRSMRTALDTKDVKLTEKAAEEMATVAKYCIEDSVLCIDLFEELNTWIMLTETSSIVRVKLMDVFTRGQQLRVRNLIFEKTYNDNFIMDERTIESGKFSGGLVQEPMVGKWRWIPIYDFASLYPSIIRAYNLCFSTLVPPESGIPDSMCNVMAWDEIVNGKSTHYKYRFIQEKYFHGFLPRISEDLVQERKATRSKIGPNNSPLTNNVLNQRQLGLKVSGNSVFGSLGFTKGTLPLPEVAHTITATGRHLISACGEYVQKTYQGTIVYGDTDSIMPSLGITDPHECLVWGKRLEKELSALFRNPLYLEHEATFAVAIFIKKKKYAGVLMKSYKLNTGDTITQVPFATGHENTNYNLYKIVLQRKKEEVHYLGIPTHVSIVGKTEVAGIPFLEGGIPDPKSIYKKGIVLARRDNCAWLRDIYRVVLLNVLFDKPLKNTLDIIDDSIINMMTRQVPFDKLTITKAIGSNYKPNSNYPLKIFADEMRKKGRPVKAGERFSYVFVIDEQCRDKQGYKMRTPEMYRENIEKEPLDRIHYVEKILKNPIEQIMYVGYKQEIDILEKKYSSQTKKRGKIYTYMAHDYIMTWVKLLKKKEEVLDQIYQYGVYLRHREKNIKQQKQVTNLSNSVSY